MNTPYTCDSHHKQYHHCAHLDSLLLHSYNISKDKWNAKLRINMSWICFTILVAVKCSKAILFQKNKNKKCSKNKKNHQRHYQRIKLLLRFSRMRYRKVIGYLNEQRYSKCLGSSRPQLLHPRTAPNISTGK